MKIAGRIGAESPAACERAGQGVGRFATVALSGTLLAAAFFATSCSFDIRIGKRPDLQALEKRLTIGQSTEADVIRALGEPLGKGRSMLPIAEKPRTMWSYYYSEATLEDGRATYLFVYFDKNSYDVYMWFSSLPR